MPGPKKAQRTKGNVKPSSSSQAAQLLAASGHAPTGFIGFSLQPAYVPVSETFDEAESALDGDFRLVLRKLSKRDTVTKIKALQEFSSLCTSKDEETVKAVVPFWPRLYNKIAIDVDHKVRGLTQKATASLASRTGKAMAPHLKSIMGMWVVSMCDTYPTVASAANQAFTSRFPGPKQAEAIRFCRAEIVECLMKNILSHSKQTLSDPQTTSDEDMEAKYQRVVTSSLQGLRKVLGMLPSDSVSASMTDHMTSLLESPAFWKHAKSAVPSVKGGMLSLLAVICQLCPDASGGAIAKVSPFVLSFLDCVESSIVSYAWEAALSLVSAHEDCWQYVNWQKAVWPKLKSVLESGCSGQASIVGPCLLPLLSKIPTVNFAQFFNCFRLGLIEDSLLNSPSELNAMVKSLQECMQYAVKCLNSDGKTTEIRDLLLDQMLTVVQGSLTEPKPSLSRTELYANLNALLSSVTDIDADTEKGFWSDLSAFSIGRLQVEFEEAKKSTRDGAANPELFERLALLVRGLVFKESAAGARRERVKFAAGTTEDLPGTRPGPGGTRKEKTTLSASADGFVGNVLVAVFKMATVEEMAAPRFISLFSQLANVHVPSVAASRLNTRTDRVSIRVMEDLGLEPGVCLSRDCGRELVERLKSRLALTSRDDDSDNTGDYTGFVVEHLIPFLFYAELKQSEKASCSAVLALFALLVYMEDSAALEILSSVIESVSDPFMTCQLIEQTFLMAKAVPACKSLSEGEAFAKHIERLTLGASMGDGGPGTLCFVWKMLTSVVSALDDGDNHTVSEPCLNAVMSSCVATLKQISASAATNSSASRADSSKQEPEALSAVVSLVHVLMDKRKILTHPLLGDLVLNLLPLVLQLQPSEQGESLSLEQLWLTGLGLVLQSKSDLEIQNLLGETCCTIKDWAAHKLTSRDSLTTMKRVVKLLVSSIVLTWNESDGRNDITSRLSNLNFDPERELKDEDESLDVDFPALSAAIDSLLVEDAANMQGFDMHCAYLYVSRRLSSLPRSSHTDAEESLQLPVQTVIMSSLFNLSVLEVIMGLSARLGPKEGNTDVHPLSVAQLLCLRRLYGKLILLEAAQKMNSCQLSEFPALLSDLQAGLVRCVKGLTSAQLAELADSVCKEDSSETRPLELAGITGLVEVAVHYGQITRKVSSVYKAILLQLRTESEVTGLLGAPEGSGDSLGKVFVSSCDSEGYDVKLQAACISGFPTAAGDLCSLSDATKISLFQRLVEVVNQLKEKNVHLLTSGDTMPVSPGVLQLNVSIARAMKDLMVASDEHYWEFVLCALVEWIQFLSEGRQCLSSDAHLQALAVSVWEMSHVAALTFKTDPAQGEASVSTITEKSKTEWSEFFAEGVFSPLLPMFVSLASSDSGWRPEMWRLVMAPLSSAVSLCPDWLVLSHQLPARLTASDTSSLPDSLKTLLNHLCPLLTARERCVEVAAYHILRSVVEEIAKQDEDPAQDGTKGAKAEGGEEEEELKSPPEALMVQIEAAGHFLECLKVVQVDDHIVMDQGTEERAQAMGYLLSWRLLLQLFKSSKDELRAKYAQYFKTHSSVSRLLDYLFRLMPQHPDPPETECSTQLIVVLSSQDELNAEMEWLAMQVYRGCLEILPALVRAWWMEQDRKASNFVDRFTTQYLSQGLIVQQISSAQGEDGADSGIEGITIKTRPAAREVLATYEMAEVTVNMTITLPENFPLGKLAVACDKRVGVSQAQWDRWLLQLNIFLQHQNGSIVEGLRLWKGNIDKKFDGLDDCMVCFSVIHGTTLQLPRLTCRTCRKKFHSSCLYKWFSTSQKSSCPLCRNLF